MILNPGHGWRDAVEGPEDDDDAAGGYGILGGTKANALGTLQEVVCVDAGEVEGAPEGLSDVEAGGLPLTGVTAWRALVTKSGNAVEGRNVLVTGIGGGVALMVLGLGVGMGVRVWVTSGDEGKIRRARELGARGGVDYRVDGWEEELRGMLPRERPFLDAVIDGAGGDVVDKGVKLLKVGGGAVMGCATDWLLTRAV